LLFLATPGGNQPPQGRIATGLFHNQRDSVSFTRIIRFFSIVKDLVDTSFTPLRLSSVFWTILNTTAK